MSCATACDVVLELDVTSYDASGVLPGQVVCVRGGEREFLRIRELHGSEGEPIVVQNCDGQAVIRNADRGYGMVFEGDSEFFHMTGTGDDAFVYGFDISASAVEPWPGMGLWMLERSTNYEIDHAEVHHTGFAGVMAKTDPLCDGSADQGVFVQRNVDLHDLYVHDTGGEGFYIGSTQSSGQTITCDSVQEVHQPHFLEGISLHHSIIENTGWDGAQVGMAHEDCSVHHNVIRNVGLEGELYQEQGLQIGTYSKCDVYSNTLENGPAMGIIVLGADETLIHSNLIVGFGEDGIYANMNNVLTGPRYRFEFNTIVDYAHNGITVFGPTLGPSDAGSNLVIGPGSGIAAGGDVDWTTATNLVFADRAAAGFDGDDFHLTEDSPLRGAGTAVAGIELDHDDEPRANPPSVGAYEYVEPEPEDTDVIDTDVPGDTDRIDTDAPTDSDPAETDVDAKGCGCGGSASGAWLALLALVAARRAGIRA